MLRLSGFPRRVISRLGVVKLVRPQTLESYWFNYLDGVAALM